MTLEVNPVGVACNLACTYCYQEPMREAGSLGGKYSMEAMKEALRGGGPFTVFGGEALLVPLGDLREILRWGFEWNGHTSIQTNGALVTPEHIEAFLEFKVYVGVSMDGPGELNRARWSGSLERTDRDTELSQRAIEAMLDAGVPVSMILTIHRGNAGDPEKRDRLKAWLSDLGDRGLRHSRLHLLEVDSELAEDLRMSVDEAVEAVLDFAEFEERSPIAFDILEDIRGTLTGDDGKASCIWHGCDPYTTRAVQGIDGQGKRTNCGRTNKDGVDWQKADTSGGERYLALHYTPQEHGGCKGCRFFFACKGNCPGTAIDGDWRNRSDQCEVWFRLFEFVERRLVEQGRTPISLDDEARTRVVEGLLAGWERGTQPSIGRVLVGDIEGSSHGDAPHGDSHADSDSRRIFSTVVPVR